MPKLALRRRSSDGGSSLLKMVADSETHFPTDIIQMNASIEEVRRALDLLFQSGDTVELRCVGNRTINGFFRDFDKLARGAYDLNVNFNPIENVEPFENGKGARQKGLPDSVPGKFLSFEHDHFPTEFPEAKGRDASGRASADYGYWLI